VLLPILIQVSDDTMSIDLFLDNFLDGVLKESLMPRSPLRARSQISAMDEDILLPHSS
jgi:hypothetical protein